jgi:hypothetical protein
MWDELGIAPCDDAKAIRRAYAARLKTLDPDRDPEAFARLRRALEWALSGADAHDRDVDEPVSASPPPHREAAMAAQDGATASQLDAPPALSESPAEGASAPPAPSIEPDLPVPPSDHDDIRDRALLIALDAALRRHDATQATALYYRAAATGALSLESAPDVVERLLAVAVDDAAFEPVALRGLVRTLGLDARPSRAQVVSELRQRALARLRAEDWYDDLLVTAKQRKGRVARRRAKIARLLLGRIGRHLHPRIDSAALKSWLDQYKSHAVWLQDRLDPMWIAELDRRLRRREIFWLSVSGLIVAGLLLQLFYLLWVSITDGLDPLWPLLAGPFAAAFLLWLLKMTATALLKLTIPGWSGFGEIALLRKWAGRGRTIWSRWRSNRAGG